MVGSTGHHGFLSRVRSHKKLRAAAAAEEMTQPNFTHRRHHSDSTPDYRPRASSTSSSTTTASSSDGRDHRPRLEWDPLKLNPPVTEVPEPPSKPAGYRNTMQNNKTSSSSPFAGAKTQRPRLHHSESYLSYYFDFAGEKAKVLGKIGVERPSHDDHPKEWPFTASSVDSGKSWFDCDTDDDDDDDDEAVQRSNELEASPRRRPQAGSPDDPGYILKRGAWKRRGIFFGGQSEEVYQNDDDAFDI